MTREIIDNRNNTGMTAGALRSWLPRISGLLLTAILATFLFSPLGNFIPGADSSTQDTRVAGHGIGITSPLADCSPEAGCKTFPGDYPALYIQMVSSRSFVVGLAAGKSTRSAIGGDVLVRDLQSTKSLAIESRGHSRVTVGFDESNQAINELRIHLLLAEPLENGRRYALDLPARGLQSLEFDYHPDFTSPSIQVNQLGFLPNSDKQAFAGNWLGTAGPMPIDSTNFSVKETTSGRTVFSGKLEKVSERDAWSGNAVYRAEFNEIRDQGEYVLSVPGLGRSHAFSISDDVFEPVFRSVFRLFYHSRNSTAIEAPWADPGHERSAGIPQNLTARIHPAVATSVFSDNEQPHSYKMVWRGWFDAGDYGQYVANAAPVWFAFGLGMDLAPAVFSADDFNLPESGNGIPDFIDELEWGMDWLLTMQNPGNGGVYSRSVPVLWDETLPQDAKQPRYLFEITSHATASFAAMTALHSRLLSAWNPQRATRVLTAARSAWTFLEETEQWPAESELYSNPPDVRAGEYADRSATDNRLWAAAELFRATGEAQFKTAFARLFTDTKVDPTERVSFGHQAMAAFWSMNQALQEHGQTTDTISNQSDRQLQDKLAGILVIAADWRLRRADEHPFGAAIHQHMNYTGWGTFTHSSHAVLPLLQAWSITGKNKYCSRSATMSNPQLGANPQSISYITGVGKRSPRYPLSLLSRFGRKAEPLNGIPVNGPHFHLPAIWPSTRAVNETYIPLASDKPANDGSYDSYPPLRRYVDSRLLPPMSEPTVAEYALIAVTYGLLSDGTLHCATNR